MKIASVDVVIKYVDDNGKTFESVMKWDGTLPDHDISFEWTKAVQPVPQENETADYWSTGQTLKLTLAHPLKQQYTRG